MGDKVSIPRSFADQIGVADCLPSIRRHYIPLFNGELTTGVFMPFVAGTTITGSNGINFFQRNATVERVFMAVQTGTTDAATTGHRIDVMAGDTTVARLGGRMWSSTTTPWAEVMSTTPSNANIAAGNPIRIQGVRKIAVAKTASIWMVVRERLDS